MKKRWFVVVGAFIIQISLGAIYIWSVFQTPLLAHFPVWTERQVTFPAQIILACFALAVIIAGQIQDKVGPRPVAMAGGLMLAAGLMLASLTSHFPPDKALSWLIITYSVLGGLGIGTAYVCPLATCVKWFPDKRGLITGLAVAGFGAGAFFFAPLAKGLISGDYYQLLGKNLFRLPEAGLFNTFLIFGLIFLVTIIGGAFLLKNPEPGYRPAGWNPPLELVSAHNQRVNFSPSQMLRTWQFWLLWVVFLIGCGSGLMVIMKASPIWQSLAFASLKDGIGNISLGQVASAGALAVSILAIFNSLGRIIWGKISDLAGRQPSLLAIFFIQGLTLLLLSQMKAFSTFLTGISIIGLCFGGLVAILPAITADFFGTEHYGANYGWIFSAYGAGGLLGPYLAARLMKTSAIVKVREFHSGRENPVQTIVVGDYRQAFIMAGVFCLVAAAAMLLLKQPKAEENQ
ncbi:MAG TPA: OFA family MFS transporter [Candidatus Saccharicenans sp.]|jgi:OFA family oxalate/formate antiporter-like MFS transporter|nr:OFA family MFS transporter [Candidatus Saccharicenans sp.]HRD02182.1 OFA family MFS transporter [Candidatus Saccharicenans sp.]